MYAHSSTRWMSHRLQHPHRHLNPIQKLTTMNLRIKNMVCPRCIMAVTDTLSRLDLTPDRVELGEAHIRENLSPKQIQRVSKALQAIGFELIENANERLVQQTKQLIVEAIRQEKLAQLPLSTILKKQLNRDFSTLSRTFAAAEGRTIEKYFLTQRIEYVKELIEYNELSIKEIAYQTGFSSVAHLSRQFKQFTGLTPTEYKNRGEYNRIGIDKV